MNADLRPAVGAQPAEVDAIEPARHAARGEHGVRLTHRRVAQLGRPPDDQRAVDLGIACDVQTIEQAAALVTRDVHIEVGGRMHHQTRGRRLPGRLTVRPHADAARGFDGHITRARPVPEHHTLNGRGRIDRAATSERGVVPDDHVPSDLERAVDRGSAIDELERVVLTRTRDRHDRVIRGHELSLQPGTPEPREPAV